METTSKTKANYTAEYIVAGGYIIFFCLVSIACLTFYYLTFSQQSTPPPVNVFATSLPPTTPTPHFPLNNQSNASKIFEDDFSRDKLRWEFDRDIFKEELRDGKLYFESRIEDNYAFTGCRSCPYLNEPFYLQADFTTTKATDEGFGIIFGLNNTDDSFYLFQINLEAKKYYFFHRSDNGWSLRAAGESDQIKSFPAINILGLHADADTVEFYVNGKVVDSYKQSGFSFHAGYFSFFVRDAGFKLIVDNLVIYEAGKQ